MTTTKRSRTAEWMDSVINQEEIDAYLNEDGTDFIDEDGIWNTIHAGANPDDGEIRRIIEKAKSITRLDPEDVAKLIHVTNPALWDEMYAAGMEIKKTVYGTRIVTFAPLYTANYCVNSCTYCGFAQENCKEKRRRLSMEEVAKEAAALQKEGHKRLIMSYGEHYLSDADYIAETMRTVYDTKVDNGMIRRVNVNAAPMEKAKLAKLQEVGIGTYQVFQESYHRPTYERVHPRGLKANYHWRLYALHRAYEAGIDDLGIGALFGLYDWRFEVMGLLHHTIDLEKRFNGVGPHTISFPRIRAASESEFSDDSPYAVTDEDFKKIVTILRLAVPYCGLIITAREPAEIRDDVMMVGCTQLDFSSKIGIGAYDETDSFDDQDLESQQFELGDTRTLDEAIGAMAEKGLITSFCTAGYRCGRTGDAFMNLAKDAKVHHFCMPNAVLTFKEYLLDYASEKTRAVGEALIEKELENLDPVFKPVITEYLDRMEKGERDLMV